VTGVRVDGKPVGRKPFTRRPDLVLYKGVGGLKVVGYRKVGERPLASRRIPKEVEVFPSDHSGVLVDFDIGGWLGIPVFTEKRGRAGRLSKSSDAGR
jgi:hypothetical protein